MDITLKQLKNCVGKRTSQKYPAEMYETKKTIKRKTENLLNQELDSHDYIRHENSPVEIHCFKKDGETYVASYEHFKDSPIEKAVKEHGAVAYSTAVKYHDLLSKATAVNTIDVEEDLPVNNTISHYYFTKEEVQNFLDKQ